MARIDIKGVIIPNDDEWIYDWFNMGYASPAKVLQALAKNPTDETADIYINSPGGDLSTGVEIYEELRQYNGKIMIHVMQACSAASVVMCAGPSEISPAGLVMIHNVSGGFTGDHNDMYKATTILKTADKTVANAYAEKTGKPVSEWIGKMNAETWLSADEVVELGLVDKISEATNGAKSGNIPAMAAAGSGMIPHEIMEKMRNERAKAKARLKMLSLKK